MNKFNKRYYNYFKHTDFFNTIYPFMLNYNSIHKADMEGDVSAISLYNNENIMRPFSFKVEKDNFNSTINMLSKLGLD